MPADVKYRNERSFVYRREEKDEKTTTKKKNKTKQDVEKTYNVKK